MLNREIDFTSHNGIPKGCNPFGRAVPAAVPIRSAAAWLTQHSQYTPLNAASVAKLLPTGKVNAES